MSPGTTGHPQHPAASRSMPVLHEEQPQGRDGGAGGVTTLEPIIPWAGMLSPGRAGCWHSHRRVYFQDLCWRAGGDRVGVERIKSILKI